MPFKMMGKSPLMKKLIGKQGNLPPALKAEIKASTESPVKLKKTSPAKNEEKSSKQKINEEIGNAIKNTSNFVSGKNGSFSPGISDGSDRRMNESFSAYAKRKAQKEKDPEKKAPEVKKKETVTVKAATEANKLMNKIMQDSQNKRAAAGGDRFSKAYAKRGKEYKAMSLAEYTTEAKKQIANRKKTGKYIGGEVKKQDGSKIQRSQAEKDFLKQQEADRKAKDAVEPKKSDFTKSQFGKKAINRGGRFTDEYGNTYERSVKGRKKDDGSVSKTVSNKTNDVTTREKDVTKGPKVKGKRRAKTVTKTKFDSSGKVRKVVEKTRGQKRKNLTDPEIKKKTAELKKRREERDNSPTKMKTKTPSKMMKKSPSKMMKKKSVKKADLKALQSFSKSSKSKYNSAVANKSKQKYPSPSTSKPSKSSFVSKLESKGTIKSSKNLTAAEKKKLASMKTGPAKMMKKKK